MTSAHSDRLVLVNLTPHTLVVYSPDRAVLLSVVPSGPVARVSETSTDRAPLHVDGVAVPRTALTYGGTIEGLPDPRPGVAYVVSRITAAVVRRPDVYFPAGEVRDTTGRIIGCTGLGQFVEES